MRPHLACVSRSLLALTCLAAGGVLLACADGAGQGGGTRAGAALPAEAQLFDEARAWAHLEALVAIGPRPAGSGGAVKTIEYLEAQLKSLGLTPVRESFIARATPAGDVPMCNLYVDLPAAGESANKAPMVVLGSHFDTKRFDAFSFIGANDGGSSTAVLLELARVLSVGGPRKVAYRLLFIDGEEAIRELWQDPDNRYGSRHHVEQLKASGLLTRVKAFVLLDLVGDKELRINRDKYSDAWLYECFAAPARAAGMSRFVDGPAELIADDHLSFLEGGVPSVDLIDLDYGPSNSWWHTPQDTLDKCSPKSLTAIGRITLMGLPNVERRLLGK